MEKHGDVRSYLDKETQSRKVGAFWASRDKVWMYCYIDSNDKKIRTLNDEEFSAKFILASNVDFPIDAWELSAEQSEEKKEK